jgi:tetratricopeptide (TPR) repeat protein
LRLALHTLSPDSDEKRVEGVLSQKDEGNAKLKKGDLGGAAGAYSAALREVSSWGFDKLDEEEKEARFVLLNNRALVYNKMGKHDAALTDCDDALAIEGKGKVVAGRSKALFRRGQAFEGMGQPEKAVHAWMDLLKADPENVAAAKGVRRLKKKVHGQTLKNLVTQGEAKAAKAAAEKEKEVLRKRKEDAKRQEETAKATTSAATSTTTSSPPSSASAASSSPESKEGKEVGTTKTTVKDFRGDDVIVRGYKQTTSGQTTSYFDTERTAEEKALIGDIAPKRIDPATLVGEGGEGGGSGGVLGAAARGGAGGSGGGGGGRKKAGSVWNQAGTYEEKNVSEWARNALETALLRASFTAASGEWSVRVAGVKDMKGDAEIVAMRGKRRHIFEFSFTLKWEVVFTGDGDGGGDGGGGSGGKKVRGGLAYSEVSALDVDDIDQVRRGSGRYSHRATDRTRQRETETETERQRDTASYRPHHLIITPSLSPLS